jgi:transcriptional regulator with XRE-family HTH domain
MARIYTGPDKSRMSAGLETEPVTDPMIGHVVRTLRVRQGWRQEDLARRSRVSRSTVARIERGQLRGISLERVRRVLEALNARLDLIARWNAGDLDRLLNARHSAMHEAVAAVFRQLLDWEIAPEVSFSIYGERGVIDLLAWHAASRTLLVVEMKTEIVDVNELMGKADQRRRLAAKIAADRGWRPAGIAVWVVVADSRTSRRRLAAHRTVLRAAFPVDGRSVASWLRTPSGPLAALSFLTNGHDVHARIGLAPMKRVRVARPRSRAAGDHDMR